jgi:SAM-dependent methyltransferase
MNVSRQEHWDAVHRAKDQAQTSWYCPHLDESLRLIGSLELPRDAAVLDVGGGRATLVDDMLARGFGNVSVLDVSAAALAQARSRLNESSSSAHWICGDVTQTDLPNAGYALWHDRAVFHFLVADDERQRYLANVANAVMPGGHAIIATFAPDGPERCSDLPVCRYDAATLAALFAAEFDLIAASRDLHRTPTGREQPFTYVVLQRRHAAANA